jgi:hypothetical protein
MLTELNVRPKKQDSAESSFKRFKKRNYSGSIFNIFFAFFSINSYLDPAKLNRS